MATVTRRDLTEAVCDEMGLVHRDAAELVDGFFEAIAERLSAGEEVKISSFGSFTVREKGLRMGRNPRTGRAGGDPAAPRRGVPALGETEGTDQRDAGRRGGRRVGRPTSARL